MRSTGVNQAQSNSAKTIGPGERRQPAELKPRREFIVPIAVRFAPSELTVAMSTTETPAAIKTYSTAPIPASYFKNLRTFDI